MKRVHRELSREEVEALRDKLAALVPQAGLPLPELLLQMRLIARLSQAEYAALCGVSRKTLSGIEAGSGDPTMRTVEKLLRPFGFALGAVARRVED